VREATDRNTLEQQELLEDLRTFSNKIKVVAVIVVGLLAVGVLLNLIMFFHLQRVLP
jgi:CMP-2-keto-3-deoxyoctulosonic acid synthetase